MGTAFSNTLVLTSRTTRVGKVRHEILGGRQYLVAPLTALVPGVLRGSQGPGFYPPEEVAQNVERWNGMPLTAGHPSLAGKPVSARTPGAAEQFEIGRVYNTKYVREPFPAAPRGSESPRVRNRLTAEGWFDVERVRQVDSRILDALNRGQPIELSTGLYLDAHPAPAGAVHNGVNSKGKAYTREYSWIAKNFRPDHLAVLMDEQGACSLEDGCGVLANANPAGAGIATDEWSPLLKPEPANAFIVDLGQGSWTPLAILLNAFDESQIVRTPQGEFSTKGEMDAKAAQLKAAVKASVKKPKGPLTFADIARVERGGPPTGEELQAKLNSAIDSGMQDVAAKGLVLTDEQIEGLVNLKTKKGKPSKAGARKLISLLNKIYKPFFAMTGTGMTVDDVKRTFKPPAGAMWKKISKAFGISSKKKFLASGLVTATPGPPDSLGRPTVAVDVHPALQYMEDSVYENPYVAKIQDAISRATQNFTVMSLHELDITSGEWKPLASTGGQPLINAAALPARNVWTPLANVADQLTINPMGQWEPPDASEGAPQEIRDILRAVYAKFRDEHPAERADVKATGARMAWGAVKAAGWQKGKDGKWVKRSKSKAA